MDIKVTLRNNKEFIVLTTISLFSVIFQLSFYSLFEFHRDELLYFSLGQHLALGYHSVPPLIGLLAFISTKIFGYTLFAARFFPALAGGILIYLSGIIAKELKGGLYAQVLTAVSILVSLLFIRAFGLFQPVVFDILIWTLAIYLFIRYLNSNQPKYILLFGVVIGIGFLNKYNILFLVFALFTAVIFTRHRKIYTLKHLYIAALVAFVIALPNIIWQIAHDFPVISHMAELRDSQLVNMNPTTFLTEQLLMVIPSTIIAIPAIFFLLISKHLKDYRVLGYYAVAVLAFFLLLNGKTYYSAGIYPMLIAGGAVIYERILKKIYSRIILIAILLVLGYINLPMGKPIYRPEKLVAYFDKVKELTGNDAVRRDEDNNYNKLPQDYSDMLGWEELTSITNKAWQLVQNKNSAIIYAENYGQAGAICVIGKKYNLPNALSFNDNFRFWLPKSFLNEITEIVYINNEVGEDVQELFADIQKVGSISNPLAREFGTSVYLCQNPKRSFNKFWDHIMNSRE
jgi:hypothetical protein